MPDKVEQVKLGTDKQENPNQVGNQQAGQKSPEQQRQEDEKRKQEQQQNNPNEFQRTQRQ